MRSYLTVHTPKFTIIEYNDDPETTHAQIMIMFDQAIIDAKSDQAIFAGRGISVANF
jgi:hypothetical protein